MCKPGETEIPASRDEDGLAEEIWLFSGHFFRADSPLVKGGEGVDNPSRYRS